MVDKLLSVFQDMVLEDKVSAADIAKGIHKPYSTLLRECNPYDTGAKLGALTMFQIMDLTGSVEPLRYMAGEMGYKLVPLEESSKK